jgi:hypothetical protein
MSYEVFLQSIADDSDDAKVWSLLEEAWDKTPDDRGWIHITRGDMVTAVHITESPWALMFSNPKDVADFDLMVDVARAGRMVILPLGCAPCVAAERDLADFPKHIVEALGPPVLVADGGQLLELIRSS